MLRYVKGRHKRLQKTNPVVPNSHNICQYIDLIVVAVKGLSSGPNPIVHAAHTLWAKMCISHHYTG